MATRIENIWEKGALIQVNFSVWTGKVKMPVQEINAEIDPEFFRASKFLVDREVLKPIEKVRNEARAYIYSKTVPFDIPGMAFIPKDLIATVDSRLKEYETETNEAVNVFAQNYETFIRHSKERLGSHFDPSEYPQNIWKHFGMSWRFLVMDTPGSVGLLPPEVYEREKQKFVLAITEFQNNATATLRKTFAEMIDHIAERLSGEKKTFRDTLIGNILEFITDFKALNITDDVELEALTNRCQVILGDVDPQDIRNDESLREHIARKVTEVQATLDTMMVDRPTRKLRRIDNEPVAT